MRTDFLLWAVKFKLRGQKVRSTRKPKFQGFRGNTRGRRKGGLTPTLSGFEILNNETLKIHNWLIFRLMQRRLIYIQIKNLLAVKCSPSNYSNSKGSHPTAWELSIQSCPTNTLVISILSKKGIFVVKISKCVKNGSQVECQTWHNGPKSRKSQYVRNSLTLQPD